jgi:uncharacterized membrane protein YdjX (TVP38/TMEM64 family)
MPSSRVQDAGQKRFQVLRLAMLPAIVVVALLLAWKLGYFELDRRRELIGAVERVRGVPWSETAYLIACAVAITLCLPANIVTVLGGAIFGPWMGALLAWGASMIATVLAHVLARRLARAPLQKLFGEHRLLKRLKDNDGVGELFRLRIIPVAPFAVLDYVAGIAAVSLPRLLVATAIGVLPSVAAYAYVGSELLQGMVSQSDAARRALWMAGFVTLAMLTISVVPGLVRRIRD